MGETIGIIGESSENGGTWIEHGLKMDQLSVNQSWENHGKSSEKCARKHRIGDPD